MAKSKKPQYICAFTGERFETDDEKLLGLGNPPRSPNTPVGAGGQPMAMVPREETKSQKS